MSRSLDHLHPAFRPQVDEFLTRCALAGHEVLVTCTYRSNEEQAQLYAQGRTKRGRRVTNARPGQSKHNNTLMGKPASLALDIVPIRLGKLIWGTGGNGVDNDPSDDDTDDLELWQRIGAIGEECGMDWAGRWITFREFPHFQFRGVL